MDYGDIQECACSKAITEFYEDNTAVSHTAIPVHEHLSTTAGDL